MLKSLANFFDSETFAYIFLAILFGFLVILEPLVALLIPLSLLTMVLQWFDERFLRRKNFKLLPWLLIVLPYILIRIVATLFTIGVLKFLFVALLLTLYKQIGWWLFVPLIIIFLVISGLVAIINFASSEKNSNDYSGYKVSHHLDNLRNSDKG
jgi:hypothetical protein